MYGIEPLEEYDMNELMERISGLDKGNLEQIAFIIIDHYMSNNKRENPFLKKKKMYGMKISVGGKGFSLDLSKLPPKLLGKIAGYCYR